MISQKFDMEDGVRICSNTENAFEKVYMKVREKEERLLSDEEVQLLPDLPASHKHHKEWLLRKKSLERFIGHIKSNKPGSVLEIGCGNGWFINHISKEVDEAVGVDINLTELKQAARVFDNVSFVYWSLFDESPFDNGFDMVVLNSTIQYFEDPKTVIHRLSGMFPGVEIHIMDSPLYNPNETESAKKRSQAYYSAVDVSEMSGHYYHHSIEVFDDADILYKPLNKWVRKVVPDSPFPWIRIKTK